MDLAQYFSEKKGLGVLSTADGDGVVNSAVYSRPHVMDDGALAFIMRDRLSHHNLQSNPRAAYLFREEGPGYTGVRLHLTKVREESDTELLKELCRRCEFNESADQPIRHLVFFQLDKHLPLLGSGES